VWSVRKLKACLGLHRHQRLYRRHGSRPAYYWFRTRTVPAKCPPGGVPQLDQIIPHHQGTEQADSTGNMIDHLYGDDWMLDRSANLGTPEPISSLRLYWQQMSAAIYSLLLKYPARERAIQFVNIAAHLSICLELIDLIDLLCSCPSISELRIFGL
jgi:hypothetical protein